MSDNENTNNDDKNSSVRKPSYIKMSHLTNICKTLHYSLPKERSLKAKN